MTAWTQRYRPKLLKGIVGQDVIVGKVKKLLQKPEEFPHLLFYSSESGTGKSTLALIIASKLMGGLSVPNADCMIYNTSKMKIDDLREELNDFASHKPSTLISKHSFPKRIAILEEIDYLATANQAFLRRLVEVLEGNCVFIATCNDLSRVSKPLISRFGGGMQFRSLPNDIIIEKLQKIAKKEKVKVPPKSLENIALECAGDLRLGISLLQQKSGDEAGLQKEEKNLVKLYQVVNGAFSGKQTAMGDFRTLQKEGTITIWQLRKYVYSVAMSRKRYDLLPLLNKEAVDSDIACAELIWGVIRK